MDCAEKLRELSRKKSAIKIVHGIYNNVLDKIFLSSRLVISPIPYKV